MKTHSSILARETPWTEEPGGLQSKGAQSCIQLSDLSMHTLSASFTKHHRKNCDPIPIDMVKDEWNAGTCIFATLLQDDPAPPNSLFPWVVQRRPSRESFPGDNKLYPAPPTPSMSAETISGSLDLHFHSSTKEPTHPSCG